MWTRVTVVVMTGDEDSVSLRKKKTRKVTKVSHRKQLLMLLGHVRPRLL